MALDKWPFACWVHYPDVAEIFHPEIHLSWQHTFHLLFEWIIRKQHPPQPEMCIFPGCNLVSSSKNYSIRVRITEALPWWKDQVVTSLLLRGHPIGSYLCVPLKLPTEAVPIYLFTVVCFQTAGVSDRNSPCHMTATRSQTQACRSSNQHPNHVNHCTTNSKLYLLIKCWKPSKEINFILYKATRLW